MPKTERVEWRCEECGGDPCILLLVKNDWDTPIACPIDGREHNCNWQRVEEEELETVGEKPTT